MCVSYDAYELGSNNSRVLELEYNNTNLWITKLLDIYNTNPTHASKLLKNLYSFEAKVLKLGLQELSYHEYMVLMNSKNLEEFYMEDCVIKDSNGSLVSPEVLMKHLYYVKLLHL